VLLIGNEGLSWRHVEAAFDVQNEPNLDLTVEESQQRIARVMQSATACIDGAVQVRSEALIHQLRIFLS